LFIILVDDNQIKHDGNNKVVKKSKFLSGIIKTVGADIKTSEQYPLLLNVIG